MSGTGPTAETALDNLVSLCRRHHRLVHEGKFGVHADAEGDFVFTTPAGVPIPEFAGPASGPALPLKRVRAAKPTDLSGFPAWKGETMDYDYMAGLLAQAEAHPESANC